MVNHRLNAYKTAKVKTASQGALILMLYDEGIRQIKQGADLIKNKSKKLDQVHNALVKAQDILTELMVGLDFEKGQEIAQNLFNIYLFCNEKLKEGNLRKDSNPLFEVLHLLSELRDAWAAIVPKANRMNDPNSGVNIAG
jgi:flagellar protein FliS